MVANAPNLTGALAADYARNGLALCAIPTGGKGPNTTGWNLPENAITDPAMAAKLSAGVGLLHVPSGTMALDVDDDVQAMEWLIARGVSPNQLMAAPDHVGIVSGREGRGKLIYRLPEGVRPVRTLQIKGVAGAIILEFRCADARGNSMQDVLPPSIHPDTAKRYVWRGLGNWRNPPLIPEALLNVWLDELAIQSMSKRSLPPQPNLQRLPRHADGLADTKENRVELARLLGLSIGGRRLFDPNASHDEWLHDLFCVAALGLWAKDTAMVWSQEGDTFHVHKFEQDWASYDPSRPGGITEASFFAKLRDAGVQHHLVRGAALPSTIPPVPPLHLQSLPPPPPVNLPLLMTADQLRKLPATPYVVRSVFPAEGLAAIYGEPGSGKSFLALHLAHAIATGTADWFGFRVRQRPVVYVVLEGVGGIGKRATAMEMHSKRRCPDGLRFWRREIHLVTGDGIDLLASEIFLAMGAGAVVIIDTLNQASPGADENASQDMGRIISNSKRLAAAVSGLVILVHHAGKNRAQGLRGHSSLHAAMDVVIEVATLDNKHKTWTITKAKDDSSDVNKDFDLVAYILSRDEYGDPITSCAVQQTIHATTLKLKQPTGKNQKAALEALRNHLRQPGMGIDYKSAIVLVATCLPPSLNRKSERAKEAIDALLRTNRLVINELGVCLA